MRSSSDRQSGCPKSGAGSFAPDVADKVLPQPQVGRTARNRLTAPGQCVMAGHDAADDASPRAEPARCQRC